MDSEALRVEDGLYSVWATVQPCGEDWNIAICGGELAHIGAAALGIPYPSLRDDGSTSASVSVLCAPEHKDDEIARDAAYTLASATGRVVVVTAGLHIDNISSEGIGRLWDNYRLLLGKLEQLLTK